MDSWPSVFFMSVKWFVCVCIYILQIAIAFIAVDISIHINQLWITQNTQDCNKQQSSLNNLFQWDQFI